MSPAEVVRWQRYYDRWPFDDLHRHHRPAALVSAALKGGSAESMTELVDKRVEWLEDSRGVDALPQGFAGGYEYTQADINTLRALGVTDRR